MTERLIWDGYEFPWTVEYQGRQFEFTGKFGHHIESREASAEYNLRADGVEHRVWLRLPSGIMNEE